MQRRGNSTLGCRKTGGAKAANKKKERISQFSAEILKELTALELVRDD